MGCKYKKAKGICRDIASSFHETGFSGVPDCSPSKFCLFIDVLYFVYFFNGNKMKIVFCMFFNGNKIKIELN